MRTAALVGASALALVLSGCGSVEVRDGPGEPVPPAAIPDAVPRHEPLSKYGNPPSYVVFGKRYYTLKSARGFVERGIASWYGQKFHGRRTSSGEIYDMYRMTAAHKQLPLPCYVQVTNLENGRVITLRVNDRGPFHQNRVIDLSYAAALKLGMADAGTAFVEVRAIDRADQRAAAPDARDAPEPPAPAAAPATGVYLQVGAFQHRANAQQLAARLEAVAPGMIHVRELDSGGRVYYRVHIGAIDSVETADRIVAALGRLGIVDHHFVNH